MNELLKKIRLKNIIVSVPAELKESFDQMQLKNSIYRLKLLGAITVFFNVVNCLIYIIDATETNSEAFYSDLFLDLCHFFVTLFFFILTDYFSKKSKRLVLWFMCYLYIILLFILSAYLMPFNKIFIVLQNLSIGIFIYVFVPDFKPKIFIGTLILWYLTVAALLKYNGYPFVFGEPQGFVINIFLVALAFRIFLYNNRVKRFINTSRINALNEKLEALSMTDELTKLDNRRSFLEHIDLIWKQNHRLNLPVTVLMIDVDYFKKYNDSLGHLEGDKALIAIAQCMKNHIKRETDFVARFGGEEFVCLLPFIEKDEALEFAKTLVQDVEDMKIPHPMSLHSKYVTISVGMASTVPNDTNSYTQLLEEADKALYSAKESGRNRVVMN